MGRMATAPSARYLAAAGRATALLCRAPQQSRLGSPRPVEGPSKSPSCYPLSMPAGDAALTPPLSPAEAKRMSDVVDLAVRNFHGIADELEGAIGMYMLGRHVGWRVLVLVHSKRTIKKYESILGIDVRTEFPEEGPDVDRSMGYRLARSLSNFWKAVSGEEKIENKRVLE